MRRRCRTKYKHLGITVDPRWEDYFVFLNDMGVCPEGMALERVDNKKGYSKDNCRWASKEEQARNRSNNRWITIGQRTLIVSDWARLFGTPVEVVTKRMTYGWDTIDALTAPVRKYTKKAVATA